MSDYDNNLTGVLFKYVEWPGLAAAGGRGLIAALFLIAVSWRSLHFTWSRLQLAAAAGYAACTVLFTLANIGPEGTMPVLTIPTS